MEELLTTEPGPPKGAKPVNGIAKTIAPPVGAKKKEDTVSEPDSNVGSTQAGLEDSQGPGPKGAKPSGKSTEDNEYTRYFNAYQEKLSKQYSDKLSKEIEPYDQALATKPDLTNQSAIDEYNRKVNERNAFVEKRSKEIDQEFQGAVKTEFDRVKNQVEGFNKAITDFSNREQERQKMFDLSNKERNPFVTAWTTASSTLTKDLPSSFYGTKSILGSIANKIDTKIEEGIQGAAKMLQGKNYNPENIGQSIFEKTQKIGRQEVVSNLKKAIDLSDLGAEQKANLTNSLEKVKDGDFVDYLNYIGSAVGQGIGQIPASIGTRGATSLVQEIGSIYIDSVKKIAEEESQKTGKEVTYEDVIMQGKDEVVWPMITGMAAGLLDAYGANKLNPFGKKEVLDSFRKRALALGKVVGTETVTEGTQGALENIGASKRDDQTWADVFKEFNWTNVAESALQGGIASLFLGGAGQGISKALERSPEASVTIQPIKVDTGKLSKRYQPIQPIVSPAQVVSEARTSVKSADDTQGAEAAAEKILETTQSPNATEGQDQNLQTDGKERNGQGRQEGLLTQETGGWKAGDIIPANYPQPERVIKSVDEDMGSMVKVTFGDGTKGAIQKKKPTPVVEEKPAETKQSTPSQAIDKYENDEKFTIDDLVDELESSDDPKIQEAVSKYRADVREGLEVWGGREDSEAREMGFVNEVKKITGEPQQSAPDISTVGTNYQKVNGNWQVKQADGSWADIVTDTPNKTPEQQSTELTQMKDLLSQMEASEPQNLKMSPTEKGRIAKLEPQTERGAVRKFFWDGGKVLWRTQDPKSSIPRKGIAEEGGLSESEKTPIKEYVDDKKGLSIDQVVESIMDQYTDMEGNKRFTDSDAVKTAVIEVLAQSDPKTWYAEQMETEDQEYLLGKPARDEEMSNLSGKIAHLEAEEQGINETNKQLYENERRVDRGGESQSGSQADGQVRGEQKEEEGGREPALLIQQNGNRDKSQQALKELRTLNLTHVPGLGMGQNQAKGTYISTEEQNRYETADKKAIPVTVAITNPYVADESYFDIQRAAIQKRFGKNAIEDLDTAELDLLSTMMTEYFSKENYDSIYFPKTETQEGELIVFDRSKVTIMDDARIEYENAVHASTQTTLQLEFVPDAEFLKTDKPIELREKQKKVRKDLARLNQLIKCR